jgi:hypothetical protein
MIKMNDYWDNVTVKGVDAGGFFPGCDYGIGFQIVDDAGKAATYPGQYIEKVILEDSYIHDIPRSGVYFGSNIYIGDETVPVRNVDIRYLLIEDIGCDGAKIKSQYETPRSRIHHNIIRRTGINPNAGPSTGCNGHGIAVFDAGKVDVYNNFVDTTAVAIGIGACYRNYIQKMPVGDMQGGTTDVNFYNNVGVDCEFVGISINQQGDVGEAAAQGNVYNNTLVRTGSDGVLVSSTAAARGGVSTVQDNIACDTNGGIDTNVGDTANNNLTGACSTQGFVDLGSDNFRIASTGASAYDAGGNYASPPAFDYDDVNRPQGTNEEIGAFEYIESGGGGGGGATLQNPYPSPFTIDNLEAHYPDYLFLIDEASGTSVEDYGGATDCDLTISGASWTSDSYGNYLSFDGSNDEAANATCTGFSATTVTQCAIVKIATPPGVTQAIVGVYDASDADQEAVAKVTPGGGEGRASVVDDAAASFDLNDSQPTTADNNWNLVCVRQSNTSNDISINGSAWDTATWAGTALLTGIDTISLGSRKRSSTDKYLLGNILAAWVYESSKTDAQIAAIWNSGNPWAVIGVDPSAGDPPGPILQRSRFSKGPTK